jgi:endonuclease/exonuclease/phosphatase family metal-dependent hydrolase
MFLICWDPSRGLHILAKHIRERLGYIAEELKDYDIVALQEVSIVRLHILCVMIRVIQS